MTESEAELGYQALGVNPDSARASTAMHSLSGERKRVTVMFADIGGFASLAETMDPERVRDLLNACFEQLVPPVAKYGGTVDKFIGDSVMALFGAPITHENDPERALRAALEMKEALAAFNLANGTRLSVHFGINTGLVVAGGIGTRGQQVYSVIGDAVNLAARLEETSQPGEILVGHETHRQTSHLFTFHEAGHLRLKGKAEPVPVYKLVGARGQTASLSRAEVWGLSSPLVGRDSEVRAFGSCIERLLSGKGGVISIVAEAGLGKSRLVAEMRRQVAQPGLSWREGRALSFGQTLSYWPFLEIIQSDAGITVDDSETERWNKLQQRVSVLFPNEAAELLPYLATLLSLDVPGDLAERVKYLDGEAMGRQVFRTARRYFSCLAEERPLVVVFEDVHWLDQSSAALLEHLLPLVRDLPLLICCVGRPEPQSPMARWLEVAARYYADFHTKIALTPLSPSESTRLIRNLLKVDDLSASLRETILRKAEGNPFFVEEVIRTLIEVGALVFDKTTGRWQVTTQIEHVAIPDTLSGVIMARIDRLDEEMKGVLKLAAVIGRSFFYRVLRSLTHAEQELDRHLGGLQALELVREKSRVPELEYVFKHALVQEAAYESVLLQRRRELHQRVGECIEALFAERLEEFYGLLAYHFTRAEEWQKAQDYLFKAGDQAGKLAADAEALVHYQLAMAAYTRAFGDRWDRVERAVLERKIGEALFRRGEHEQAQGYLHRALAYLGSPYPTSRWGVRLAIARQLLRQAAHRFLPGVFLRKAPAPANRIAEERCRQYEIMKWVDFFNAPEPFVLDSLLLLNVAEESGMYPSAAQGCSGAGSVLDAIPVSWLAEFYHSRAMDLAQETQHPWAVAHGNLFLGLHDRYITGRWGAALERYERGAEAFWQKGYLRGWAAARVEAAELHAQRGDFSAGLGLCLEVVRVSQEAADQEAWGWGLQGVGLIQDWAGALDEATASLQQGVVLLRGVPDHQGTVCSSGNLARCYLRQRKVSEAMAVLEDSRRLVAEHGLRGFLCVPTWMSLAQAHLTVVEQAEGEARARALRDAKRSCRVALAQGRLDCAALAAAYRMQGTYEWLRGKSGPAQRWWQRSLELAERLGARYELGLTCLEVGRRMRDRKHVERAGAVLGDIGARFDLAQARELLQDD